MSDSQLQTIIERADFIVAGYAFSRRTDGFISIVSLESPFHAALIDTEGTVLETNMYDIELDIVVNKHWENNKKQILDIRYA